MAIYMIHKHCAVEWYLSLEFALAVLLRALSLAICVTAIYSDVLHYIVATLSSGHCYYC